METLQVGVANDVVVELLELELAQVGGGIGDVILA